MTEKIDNRLKDEVESYNALNAKKAQMEKELGAIDTFLKIYKYRRNISKCC